MKRAVCLLVATFLLFIASGCGDNTESNIPDTSKDNNSGAESSTVSVTEEEMDAYFNTFENFEETFTKVYKKENNFVIKESDQHAGYFYEIYDNAGNLLDKGYHGYRGVFDIRIDGNIVTLEYGFGGTGVHSTYRFYDVAKSKVSRYFAGPIALHDGLIACLDEEDNDLTLVVQDLFDTDKTYRKIAEKVNGSFVISFDDMYFSKDGLKIILSYYDVNIDDITQEVFDLK